MVHWSWGIPLEHIPKLWPPSPSSPEAAARSDPLGALSVLFPDPDFGYLPRQGTQAGCTLRGLTTENR